MTTLVESLKIALDNATQSSIISAENEVRYAVQLIAAVVRETYPGAKTVELSGSDQGDFLEIESIDGKREDALWGLNEDDLGSAAWCIYDAHRSASPALHPINPKHSLERTEFVYIDIEEALK